MIVKRKENILDQVLEFSKKQTCPDIFKYSTSPKVHFYRDHSGGERLKVFERPDQIALSGIKGFDSRGDPPRQKSVSRISDRVSLLPEP
jgi:hypothetical protein